MSQKRKAPAVNRSPSQLTPLKGESRVTGMAQPSGAKGVAQLVAAIEAAGYRVTGANGHWMVQCPFHEDGEPSLGIDVHTRSDEPCGWRVLLNCHQCGKVGKQLSERFGVLWGDVLHHPDNRLLLERPPKRPAPLPTTDDICRWATELHSNTSVREYLTRHRCISEATLRKYLIGWDSRADAYTLPVYHKGELVNLRRYRRGGTPKVQGLGGRTVYLYPNVPAGSRWFLLCEGELDALVARSNGLPAITNTGGAGTWKPAWSTALLKRVPDIAIAYDCDKAGRTNAFKVAKSLLTTAGLFDKPCRVKVVDLAPDRDDGYDLGDYLKDRSQPELMRLIKQCSPLGGKGEGGP